MPKNPCGSGWLPKNNLTAATKPPQIGRGIDRGRPPVAEQQKPPRDKRRFRTGRSYPIPVWSGILEHREKIGSALWEFLWCLDKITSEKDRIGRVLGGRPVKLSEIATALENKVCGRKSDHGYMRTVRRNMEKLEGRGYIRRRRTPYGHVIEVVNSLKFNIWRKERVAQSGLSATNGPSTHLDEEP
jgi:hypothetical protein